MVVRRVAVSRLEGVASQALDPWPFRSPCLRRWVRWCGRLGRAAEVARPPWSPPLRRPGGSRLERVGRASGPQTAPLHSHAANVDGSHARPLPPSPSRGPCGPSPQPNLSRCALDGHEDEPPGQGRRKRNSGSASPLIHPFGVDRGRWPVLCCGRHRWAAEAFAALGHTGSTQPWQRCKGARSRCSRALSAAEWMDSPPQLRFGGSLELSSRGAGLCHAASTRCRAATLSTYEDVLGMWASCRARH